MFFEGSASEKAVASPPQTPAAEIQSMPARDFLSKQLLANTSFLHPDCQPTLTTSRDPASGATRIVILASPAPILTATTTAAAPTPTPTLPTATTAPASGLTTTPPTAAATTVTTPGVPRILYEQPGTTTADFEALLARVETDVHRRLQSLPSPGVDAARLSVDAARLQRENKALIEELQRARGAALTLVLPQPKATSALPPLPPPPPPRSSSTAADQQMEPSTTAETTATKPTEPSQTAPTPTNTAPPTPTANLTASGLPQSRSNARKKASTAAGTTITTEVSLPSLDALHDGIVSPRTIPRAGRAALLSGGGGSPSAGSAGRWGEGQEADDVAAWVRSIANPIGAVGAGEALTPPQTPPLVKKPTLPRSRKFEGR